MVAGRKGQHETVPSGSISMAHLDDVAALFLAAYEQQGAEGRYFAVRDFLARLEQLSDKLYWRSMAYHVKDYPTAEVTLEVYTLSTEKAFIGVE